jgi:general secretion pathway protein M
VNANLPTGWQGRLLALALLLLAFAAMYLIVAAPLLDLYSERSMQAETRVALLTRLNAVAAELSALHARVDKSRTAMAAHRLTLEGASDAVASAALQGRIEPLATAAGMTIGSTEILAAEAKGEYHRIGLRLIVNGTYESLIKLLARIEATAPPLVVDDLDIRSPERRLGVASALELDASFDVYGFRAAETTTALKP